MEERLATKDRRLVFVYVFNGYHGPFIPRADLKSKSFFAFYKLLIGRDLAGGFRRVTYCGASGYLTSAGKKVIFSIFLVLSFPANKRDNDNNETHKA